MTPHWNIVMLFHLHIVYGCFYYNQLFRQRPSDLETLNCLLFGFLMQKKKKMLVLV